MSSNDNASASADGAPENAAKATSNGNGLADAAAATANGAAATAAAAAPRAKIAISLKKKSKPTKKSSALRGRAPTSASLLAEEYGTVAEEAEIISQRRKEEGTVLVIPCHQSTNEEEKRKQPLLAGRLALLRSGEGAAVEDGGAVGDAAAAPVAATTNQTDDATPKNGDDVMDEDEAVKQLIQSAKQKDGDEKDATTHSGRGLVIAAPSENKPTHQPKNEDRAPMNDEEAFQQELSHHAADVDPTSTVYANVAISDFGSALLRGMGWTGGPAGGTSRDKPGTEATVKPRPHRLGLGAQPVPLPSASSSRPSSGGGIHRRARRPDEVKRDEERRKRQEEAEQRQEEKKRLDVQITLQKGSVVRVARRGDDASEATERALVVQTAGVPGLNRILIQLEGSSEKTSVSKGSVVLCSWEDLKAKPFKKSALKEDSARKNGGAAKAQSRDRSHRDDDTEERDRSSRDDRRRDDRRRDDRYDDSYDEDRRRSQKHKRKKRHRRDRSRSRSRSDSRERSGKRGEEDRRSRSRSDSRERRSRRNDSDRRRRDRSRSPNDRSSSHRKRSKQDLSPKASQSREQQQLHWLVPNIRVRLVSKKMPKYYLQKGIVQDVIAQTQNTSGPKAVLLMDTDGQVLDRVPERYLETALPRTGGNVIILESREKHHRWKKGRLLEKATSGDGGYGVVQLEEDLEVVKVDLDGLAEWCGQSMDE